MHRALELSLLMLMLAGFFLVWQSGQERSAARLEYDRIVRITGELPLKDPNKVHILALETGESLHFAWRVYLPPRYHVHLRHSSGSSSSYHSDAQHLIARVRIREGPGGRLQIYEHFAGGSGQMSLGDESLANFLRGRWDEVSVEQLGARGNAAVLDADEQAVLLRLSLPDKLYDQAKGNVDSQSLPKELPLLFELRMGPEPPQP
jgi:hypothetical protein